ncbi:MAG: hypothetical protein H7X93_04205 [Sphingomonadaceae bacterium]|nr:hypothetical protein [Sphingomonadaceae bacterium]
MSRVRRRIVLYAPGCDPRRPTFYHAMYRDEAAKQAAVSGHAIEVGSIERTSPHVAEWRVSATIEGETVETRYRLLWWDDIVRANWPRTPLSLVRAIIGGSGHALFGGVLRKTYHWSWPAAVGCSMPYFVLCGLLLLCALLPIAGWGLGGWIGFGAGLVAAIGALWIAWRLDKAFSLSWLGRIIDILAMDSQGRLPALEARREEFAGLVAEALADPSCDEVLVAGHSVGSTIAVAIVARSLAAAACSPARLSLLTLGQTNCWLAFFPGAERFRGEIAAVATSDDIDWVDFSAPPDGACFALVDPYTALGDRRIDRANPKLLNAKFHETMAPQLYDKKARDWTALHFQYMRASVAPADYDYFAITAGPSTLADRYRERRSVRDFTRLRSRAMKHVR